MVRAEHPKPQFERSNWLNLNGEWDFEIDNGKSGEARAFAARDASFNGRIVVPFCPQSALSGIGQTDFLNAVWYQKKVNLTAAQIANRVVLHFGAVDYYTRVFVNGKFVGDHKGGYVSFSFDISDFVEAGENVITVYAEDDERNRLIPSGKQSMQFGSFGCFYTRTTGIWQTVWLEFTPKTYIKAAKYYPDVATSSLTVQVTLSGKADLSLTTSFEGTDTGNVSLENVSGQVTVSIPLTETHVWEVGKGGLYDLVLQFGEDTVNSYFGLRSIEYTDYKFLLNGRSVFQRLILDQGFYPDGIYTAPADAELIADIDRSVAMGFNGARLHEKVFEERFLYHCDRKGYLVWAEYPNWGLDHTYADSIYGILPEWLEEIDRDFNHPSIVGWCPLNETWDQNGRKQFDDMLALVYHATKAADPTRPCIDTSGNFHVVTDIYDVHEYEQNPTEFAKFYENLCKDGTIINKISADRQVYDGKMPFFVSEYGGIQWSDQEGWGYGEAPKTREEFLSRLKGLTDALLDNERMFGLCYTQLTDVEQEQNGLYTYDRQAKFPPEEIYPIFARKAAIED